MLTSTTLLFGVIAFVSAMPQGSIIEKVITAELRKILRPLDPVSLGDHSNVNVTIREDTSLIFNYKNISMVDFSDIECTKFIPPILSNKVTLAVKQPSASGLADSYTVDGTLNGHSLSASGKAKITAINTQYTYTLEINNWRLIPFSMCIAKGGFNVDIEVDSLQADFVNADELNKEINDNGPQLYKLWQEGINANADQIVQNLNSLFCRN